MTASTLSDLTIMTVSSAFGTGSTIPLGSAAAIGGVTFLSFSGAGIAGGTTVSYSIQDPVNGGSEIGQATYASSITSLTGRTPTKSTNGNAAITGSSGALIYGTARAEDLVTITAATSANQVAATSNIVAVTPGVQQFHPSAAKAWVYFDGKTGATATVAASYNISGVTRNSTGNYTISFTTPFSSGSYAFNVTASAAAVGAGIVYISAKANVAAGSFSFQTLAQLSGTNQDCDMIGAEFFGAQ